MLFLVCKRGSLRLSCREGGRLPSYSSRLGGTSEKELVSRQTGRAMGKVSCSSRNCSCSALTIATTAAVLYSSTVHVPSKQVR